MFARCARLATVAWYCGNSCALTGRARADAMASLSLNQYDPATITRPMMSPMVSPLRPPNIAPNAMISPPMAASSAAVLRLFIMAKS